MRRTSWVLTPESVASKNPGQDLTLCSILGRVSSECADEFEFISPRVCISSSLYPSATSDSHFHSTRAVNAYVHQSRLIYSTGMRGGGVDAAVRREKSFNCSWTLVSIGCDVACDLTLRSSRRSL